MKKIFRIFVFAIALVLLTLPTVSASIPYSTYTYDIYGFIMESPDAYVPSLQVDARYMGISSIESAALTDLETDDEGNVYLVDSKANRVIVLDPYYKLSFIIDTFINSEGIRDSFNSPKGVFITEDEIYVCDSNNYRIVIFDREGNYLRTLDAPRSELFGNTQYTPIACAVTKDDAIYVISSGHYQGVLVLNKDGSFIQFVGGTKVVLTAWEQLMQKFGTEAMEANSEDHVSKPYNNITIDESRSFVYVTTNGYISDEAETEAQYAQIASKASDYSPVKLLNPAGNDIMKRNGFWAPSGEVAAELVEGKTYHDVSQIVDVASGEEGTWSIIDNRRARVYTYDRDGKLLFAFGDGGAKNTNATNQLGNINNLNAIAYQGSNIILLDTTSSIFTVYSRTTYGELLMEAIHAQNERDFDTAIEKWRDVLKRNNNFDEAYVQIGLAYYRAGDYEQAVEYYKLAYETENYSDAYREIRKVNTQKYLWLIPIVAIALLVGIAKFFKYAGRVNKETALKVGRKSFKEELLYVFHVIFHPFDGFWDIKHEYRGSMRASWVFILLTVAYFWYNTVGSGYIINQLPVNMSFIYNIISVLLPILLWVVANWCLTTLFDGEGTLKDIFIATSYSLLPLALLGIPATIISNVLVADEVQILGLISGISYVWVGMLIFIGMMVTHNYSMLKSITTCLFTIVGIAFIVFVAILFSSLIMKLVMFITTIAQEIAFHS
ncbi:MAG: YIP1 family protein [Clostridia bacterium]|nr:YIP1 family protein [Clostridia bacterium]